MNKYNKFLTDLFKEQSNVLVAHDLIEKLVTEFEVTYNYARQLISRAVKEKIIKSSEPFSFEKRQYFYMNQNRNVDVRALLDISRKYRKPLFRLLTLLSRTGGICSYYEAVKITATPMTNKEKYRVISLEDEIKRLNDNKIIKKIEDKETGIPFLVLLEDQMDVEDSFVIRQKIKAHLANMKRDVMFINDIIRWLVNHGFITDRVSYRRKDNPNLGAIRNDFPFDATTISKTTGFTLNTGKLDEDYTIVVMEILIYRTYEKIDLEAFYERIQSIRHSTIQESARKVMPIIFYLDVDENVKREMNNLHILNFSLKSIMGSNIVQVIEKYRDMKRIIDEAFMIDEETSSSVIEKIGESLTVIEESGQTENLQNLKGDLFETLMYTVLSNLFKGAHIEHSKIIKSIDDPKKSYEFDVIVRDNNEDEIVIIELKGLKNSTIINLGDTSTPNSIRWFFGKTYPIAKAYYEKNSEYDKSKIKGCYITSANFSQEGMQKLKELNNSDKIKPSFFDCYYDRKKLLVLLKNHNNLKSLRNKTGFLEILEKYYLVESN
ncbi:hypothetical protein [Heyndrickxia vini]|uniref:Restriction endonuclease n=1 Tax=Heyndrickxia vini TaxID=1476025 RepID=A0ABX7E0Z2_9BACI|nr:hypothetical protein [Heyndrickxia vini]QQZ09406.1 hypothetical protein I5776_21045 [Heyndrickxia vini]